jgi:hypothetical protein
VRWREHVPLQRHQPTHPRIHACSSFCLVLDQPHPYTATVQDADAREKWSTCAVCVQTSCNGEMCFESRTIVTERKATGCGWVHRAKLRESGCVLQPALSGKPRTWAHTRRCTRNHASERASKQAPTRAGTHPCLDLTTRVLDRDLLQRDGRTKRLATKR